MAVMQWIRNQKNIYFGNASSVRDYRAQLRGIKAALFWAAYLGLMIIIVTISYASIVSQGERSVTQTQNELQQFYFSVVGLLEAMMALVAPVIVAMAIQSERQRKSIDLVMTSPVTPKYYLVGKVFSGYRYILMLLFLSLPIAAAAVVLGGVTWREVLITYLLIACHGLIYIAISLPIATLCQKIVPTVLYSYAACWSWSVAGSVSLAGLFFMGGGPMGPVEAPFIMLLFPSGVFFGVDTFTTLFGIQMPNWILATCMALLLVKVFMLSAGSALTRIGSKETISLRIHGILISFLLIFLIVYSMVVSMGGLGVGGMGGMGMDGQELGVMVTMFTIPIILVLPHLSTWSYFDERKHKPNGLFSLRAMFSAAPEGGLPYLLLLVGSVIGATWFAFSLAGETVDISVLPYILWLFGTWAFFWSMGWLISSFTKTGVSTARKSHLAFTIILTLLPWPVVSIISEWTGDSIWLIYPLRALFYGIQDIDTVLAMGLEFWILAAVMAYWGEKRRKRIVSSIERGTE